MGAALFAILFAAACTEDIDQQITGVMMIEGQPASNLALRLQAGEPATRDSRLSFATDSNGAFRGSRQAQRGKVAVLVQRDTFCVLESREWHAIWHGIYGPAPAAMDFGCSRTGTVWKCTMNGLESHGR